MKNQTPLYMRSSSHQQLSTIGIDDHLSWHGSFSHIGRTPIDYPNNNIGGNSIPFISSPIGFVSVPTISGIIFYNKKLLSYTLSEIGYGEGTGEIG